MSGDVRTYGHWGRPVLAFPAEDGRAGDWQAHGLVDALRPLLDAGRLKLYCVDSDDGASWSDRSVPTEERARRHDGYEGWLLEHVLPGIDADCGGRQEVVAVGVSLGAFHAVNLALRHADRVPLAIGLSGNYEPATWRGWGDLGFAAFVHDPSAYVPQLHGEHLRWLQERLSLLLVVGEGAWEVHPTRALPSTRHLAHLLAQQGIRCELDVWGPDAPHDWPSWARQLAHHLPRFC